MTVWRYVRWTVLEVADAAGKLASVQAALDRLGQDKH